MECSRLLIQMKTPILNICRRSLFSVTHLGIDKFKKRKSERFSNEQAEEFREKIKNDVDNQNEITSFALNTMCYLVNTEEDFEIFNELTKRYLTRNKANRGNIHFRSFYAGPEIMRLCHCFNKPLEALYFIDTESNLFDNIKSFIVLMDLLYENQFYDDVCRLYHVMQKKQINGRVFTLDSYILYQAACYKLNTEESFEDAMKAYEQYTKIYSTPLFNNLVFTLLFCLARGLTKLPLKYACNHNDALSVNIKLTALMNADQCSDALCFIEMGLRKNLILKPVAEDFCNKMRSAIAAGTVTKNIDEKFKSLDIKLEHLKDQTMDELAVENTKNSCSPSAFKRYHLC